MCDTSCPASRQRLAGRTRTPRMVGSVGARARRWKRWRRRPQVPPPGKRMERTPLQRGNAESRVDGTMTATPLHAPQCTVEVDAVAFRAPSGPASCSCPRGLFRHPARPVDDGGACGRRGRFRGVAPRRGICDARRDGRMPDVLVTKQGRKSGQKPPSSRLQHGPWIAVARGRTRMLKVISKIKMLNVECWFHEISFQTLNSN